MSVTTPKSILITGCSSGIGLACAKGLADRGYRVFATARSHEDVKKLRISGLESFQLDLDDSASIHDAVDQILALTDNTLYALFNNAGYQQPGAVEDLSKEVLRANFETNFFGTHELTQRIIPIMRRQGYGRIIQNSSSLGLVSFPFRGAYNASKYALEGLTDAMRMELYGSGIHVALIEPGPIASDLRKNAFKKFNDNIDRQNTYHQAAYRGIERRLTTPGATAALRKSPDAVFEKLVHALESPKPKIRYYVTTPTYVIATLRRILSYRFLDRLILKVTRKEHE